MQLASLLERETVPLGALGDSNARCIAASALGDVFVLARGKRGCQLLYGHARRTELTPVDFGEDDDALNRLGLNAAADALFVLSQSTCLAILLPPRSGVDGGLRLDSKPKCLRLLLNEPILDARWHAFADDHLGALVDGTLRLWDTTASSKNPLWRVPTSSGVAFAWGGASRWGRFSALVLCADGAVDLLCPLLVRRCALPGVELRAMRGSLALGLAASADDGPLWLAELRSRRKWLQDAFPDDDDDDDEEEEEEEEDWVVAFAASDLHQPEAALLAPRPQRFKAAAVGDQNFSLIANLSAPSSSSGKAARRLCVLALATSSGRLDLCLLRRELEPSFSEQGGEEDRLVVVERLRLAPDEGSHCAVALEQDASRPFGLLYAHSRGASVLEFPWLEQHTLSGARPKAAASARCRHVVQTSTQKLVGIATGVAEGGRRSEVVAWLADGSALSLSLSAARYLAQSKASTPKGAQGEATTTTPCLSEEVLSLVSEAATALDATPQLVTTGGGGDGHALLVQAKQHLEENAALPLRNAARTADALSQVLKLTASAQQKACEELTERLRSADQKSKEIAADAAELGLRAEELWFRAEVVSDSSRQLRNRLSRAERDYAANLRSIETESSANDAKLVAFAARAAGLETLQSCSAFPELSKEHLDLTTQLLHGEHDLLAAATRDVEDLQLLLLEDNNGPQ